MFPYVSCIVCKGEDPSRRFWQREFKSVLHTVWRIHDQSLSTCVVQDTCVDRVRELVDLVDVRFELPARHVPSADNVDRVPYRRRVAESFMSTFDHFL